MCRPSYCLSQTAQVMWLTWWKIRSRRCSSLRRIDRRTWSCLKRPRRSAIASWHAEADDPPAASPIRPQVAHTHKYINTQTKTLHIDLWEWSWCLSVSFKWKIFIALILISQPPYLRSFTNSNAIILTVFIEKQLTYCGPSDRCVLSVSCLGSLDLLTINYTPYF